MGAEAVRAAGLAAALAGALGCVTAERNYLEPDRPGYRGDYGEAPAPRDTIRVVTFNIEYALHVPEAVEALRSHRELRDADVFLLQEMDARGVDQVATAFSLNYVYYPSSRTTKTHRDVGTAVLSPWPIESSDKVRMPHLARLSRNARSVAAADVRIGGRTLRVYSMHLATPLNLSGHKRHDQLDAVLADASAYPGPVIVGGDFNGKNMARYVAQRGYAWPTEAVGRSQMFFAFDHVLARGLAPAGAPAAGVARDVKGVSDHFPVWATFAALEPRDEMGRSSPPR